MKHIFINKYSIKTFIILHGTGGDETDLVGVVERIDSNANILGIRGNIVENGSNRFFKRFGMGSYDLDSYINETNNLKLAITKYIEKYNINKDNVYVLGFSNGANIALGLIQEYPKFLNNYILLSNDYINKEKGFNNLENVDIFMSSSERDPWVNFENIKLLIDRLKTANALIELEMINGHNITKELLDEIKLWYNKKSMR